MLGMTILANEKFADDNLAYDSELLGMKICSPQSFAAKKLTAKSQ
jgi:hypothetical protein